MKLLIINGPNLNLLGKREPSIYGTETFEEYLNGLRQKFPEVSFTYFQSNHEGEIIDMLHNADNQSYHGIILNAGGYSHSSVSIADAVSSIQTPVVGVHISNIYTREEERHKELLAKYTIGGIFGLGMKGYELATAYFTTQKR